MNVASKMFLSINRKRDSRSFENRVERQNDFSCFAKSGRIVDSANKSIKLLPLNISLILLVGFAAAVFIFTGITTADTGNSSSYRLGIQENSFSEVANSSSFSFATDSGSVGIGNSSSNRLYLGYVAFLARLVQIVAPTAAPLINFTSLVGEGVVYQSTTARFQLTVKNTGSVASTIVPRLYIYNSAGSLVYERTGTSTTLEAGATVSLLQYSTLIFSVSTIAAGTYNATVNVLFTNENNETQVTQNRSVLFEIRAVTVTTTATSGTGVTVAGGGDLVIFEQAAKEIEPGFLKLSNAPVLLEMKPGEERIEFFSIHNPSNQTIRLVTMSNGGVPEGWIFLEDPLVNVEAYSDREVVMHILVPEDAIPGNYQVRLSASNKDFKRDYFFILRVIEPLHPTEEGGTTPLFISKTARVDEIKEETHFTLRVKNSDQFARKLSVVEKIDKRIAAHVDEVEFFTPPSKIIEPDPIVEWLFTNVEPNEERNITYFVRKAVNTTKPFVYPSIEQAAFFPGVPVAPITEKVDYTPLFNAIAILMIAAASAYGAYRLEHELRKKFYIKGIRRFIGKPLVTTETGRKLGIVADVTFMPETGELLDIVVKRPTPYARNLLLRADRKNRICVPFQSVKGIGDYVVITEKDIVFDAVMKRRPVPKVSKTPSIIEKSGMPEKVPAGVATAYKSPYRQTQLVSFIKNGLDNLKDKKEKIKSIYAYINRK